MIPYDYDFEGRPQLLARLAGAGGGRSLLLNGHIDAVPYGDLDALGAATRWPPRCATATSTDAAPTT